MCSRFTIVFIIDNYARYLISLFVFAAVAPSDFYLFFCSWEKSL